ncbi:hypothetical protein WJU23_14240 [Prosthecobacter sp. SYSU 5D2]|uniref:hypothetical protein n=1 Tax=Prosthecobacter sp. SYSU 5D2 TaxID=3134134 RepID=UPI0031FE80B5
MKLPAFLIILGLFLIQFQLHAADEGALARLKESYQTAIKRATEPVHQTYISELTKLRDQYTREAMLEAAVKVQAEIDAISAQLAIPTAPVSLPTASKAQEVLVPIPANKVIGHTIGRVKKGTVITLSYVSGKWKDHGQLATENPDALTLVTGNSCRLVIADGRFKTQPGPVLTLVPAGTASTPFSYTFIEDQENVILRINEDSRDYDDNPGAVTYKVKLSQ